MEEMTRKPLQGVLNIVRFNWHFFVIAAALFLVLILSASLLPYFAWWLSGFAILIFLSVVTSLCVSYYIYDFSDFYSFEWLKLRIGDGQTLVNINAGFDETSTILVAKYPEANLRIMDFYDPVKHTEVSIQRARKAYPPFHATEKIETKHLPLAENSIDFIFLIFAAHEIRENQERIDFFVQLRNSLKPNGKIVVVEHLRDAVNFLAYNFGFFHFLSLRTWRKNFITANLKEESHSNFTPFVKIVILNKHGASS